MSHPGFWDDPKVAQKLIKEHNYQKDVVKQYHYLQEQVNFLFQSMNELKDHYDEELNELIQLEFETLCKEFEAFEVNVLLSHPYDTNNAIIELHPGAGGTESQDWAQMLFRMYNKWANKKGFKFKVLDYQDGDEAGIKSCTVMIEGTMAYGLLKAEKGVHRLVRISPFDASGRRHTSFASLDVMPEFNDEINIVIEDKDLVVETMRASGAGGQHINKTDSAVRMLHIPSQIVVTCQSERSQIANRERCLQMLKSKLYQKHIEEQEARLKQLKGEQLSNQWGSQIRSYVFCPYTLVKDHRSNYEVGNVESVMDGNIDDFIFNYLKNKIDE